MAVTFRELWDRSVASGPYPWDQQVYVAERFGEALAASRLSVVPLGKVESSLTESYRLIVGVASYARNELLVLDQLVAAVSAIEEPKIGVFNLAVVTKEQLRDLFGPRAAEIVASPIVCLLKDGGIELLQWGDPAMRHLGRTIASLSAGHPL